MARLQESPAPTLLRVTTGEILNAETLRDSVVPTLLAFENIEGARSIARGREPHASISSLSQDSPISINLTGIKETVQLILEYAIPWRRKHAERLSELEIRKRECEIEKVAQENSLHSFERERRQLDLAKLQFEVARSKWELAERMMKELDPDNQLRGEAREEALRRVLAGIDQLASTRLEFEIVRERLPKGVNPVMAPISSIMGEIMLLGLRSQVEPANEDALESQRMQLRTLGEFTIRNRILAVEGVSQVTVMGGTLRQYQIITSPA